jgi:DNA replication protein DnaC
VRLIAPPRALRTLDAYNVILMAERYERSSLVITSNLVFSEWNRIAISVVAVALTRAFDRGSDRRTQ